MKEVILSPTQPSEAKVFCKGCKYKYSAKFDDIVPGGELL